MPILEDISRAEMALIKKMPEKASIGVLQHRVEMVLTGSVSLMSEIIEDDPNPDTKIKAFNSLINLGKYIEIRKDNIFKQNEREEDELDLGYEMGVELE